LAASAALAFFVMSPVASAGPGIAADPSLEDVDARYEAIRSALGEGESSARLWWYGWNAGFVALTLGEGTVLLVTHDPGQRVDSSVGLIGAAIGSGALLISSRAAFTYRGRLAAMDASTPAARLARLHEAERILDRAADAETAGQAWFAHVGGDALTLAGTFVLWAGYHRYASGWLNLVGGVIVTEAEILTRPTAAITARRAYRAGRLPAPTPSFTWTLVPAVGGLGWLARF
jgi:hypothetical protein